MMRAKYETAMKEKMLMKLERDRLASRVKRAQFTTNPARVRYCSQELVLFRDEDILGVLKD